MLSRNAQSMYWTGRYLERTDVLCRLLRLQMEALVDRPPRDIHAGWHRLYATLGRTPPGGSLGPVQGEEFTLADSFTLAGDLTFDRQNPDSIWNCFANCRENARQMRHRISAEMWRILNLAYLRIRALEIQDIWAASPEDFYAGMGAEIGAFTGAAESAMYRDEGWRFLQLGRCIELSQLVSALLAQQLAMDAGAGEFAEPDWTGLLRAHQAVEVYHRRHGILVHPVPVLDLLVTDPLLPGSLCRSFNTIDEHLAALGPGPGESIDGGASGIEASDGEASGAEVSGIGVSGAEVLGAEVLDGKASGASASGAEARRVAAALVRMPQSGWPADPGETGDRLGILARTAAQCRELHFLVDRAYFDY